MVRFCGRGSMGVIGDAAIVSIGRDRGNCPFGAC